MEKFTNYVIKYLKYMSPVVIFAITLSLSGYAESGWLWDIAGIVAIIWFAALFYLFFALTFQVKLRNKFYRKVLSIKEYDEREMIITGNTAKKAFIAMTSFLVLLLFLNLFQIYVSKPVYENNIKVKEGRIQLGLGFSLTQETDLKTEAKEEVFVNYRGIPVSNGSTVLLILLFQFGSFYYFSRKEISDT